MLTSLYQVLILTLVLLTVIEDPAVAVAGVGTETDIAGHRQCGELGLDPPHRLQHRVGLGGGHQQQSQPTSNRNNQPTNTEQQLPAHSCWTASLSPARPSSILTARSGTPNRRTAERPSLTAGARKERTEVTPQRDTPGKLGMSCLHTRDTRHTTPTRKLLLLLLLLLSHFASGAASVMKSGSMRLCGWSSVPLPCHRRMVSVL